MNMTHRERILTAISHRVPDMVPAYAMNIDDIRPYLSRLGLSTKEELCDYLGICQRRVWPKFTLPHDVYMETGLHEEGIITVFGTAGGAVSYSKDCDDPRPFRDVQSVKEIEDAALWPSPDWWDYSAMAQKCEDVVRHGYAAVLGHWMPVICQVFDFFGMEDAMIRMHETPEIIEACIKKIEEFYLEYYRRQFEASKNRADIFCMGDDFATQRGLLFSPEAWRKFLKPTYQKLFGLAKSYGLKVWLHACGQFVDVIPDLIECGLDVWETVQCHLPRNGPEHLKREFGGDLAFYGGINTQQTLPFGTPEDVRREVRERIRVLGKGGGYICGPDHHIKPEFPIENVLALFDEAAKFRGEGITL